MANLKFLEVRGTDAERLAIILAEGDTFYCIDTKLRYSGDGLTLGGIADVRIRTDIDNVQYETIPNIGILSNKEIKVQHSGSGTKPSYVSVRNVTSDNITSVALVADDFAVTDVDMSQSSVKLVSTGETVVQGHTTYEDANPFELDGTTAKTKTFEAYGIKTDAVITNSCSVRKVLSDKSDLGVYKEFNNDSVVKHWNTVYENNDKFIITKDYSTILGLTNYNSHRDIMTNITIKILDKYLNELCSVVDLDLFDFNNISPSIARNHIYGNGTSTYSQDVLNYGKHILFADYNTNDNTMIIATSSHIFTSLVIYDLNTHSVLYRKVIYNSSLLITGVHYINSSFYYTLRDVTSTNVSFIRLDANYNETYILNQWENDIATNNVSHVKKLPNGMMLSTGEQFTYIHDDGAITKIPIISISEGYGSYIEYAEFNGVTVVVYAMTEHSDVGIIKITNDGVVTTITNINISSGDSDCNYITFFNEKNILVGGILTDVLVIEIFSFADIVTSTYSTEVVILSDFTLAVFDNTDRGDITAVSPNPRKLQDPWETSTGLGFNIATYRYRYPVKIYNSTYSLTGNIKNVVNLNVDNWNSIKSIDTAHAKNSKTLTVEFLGNDALSLPAPYNVALDLDTVSDDILSVQAVGSFDLPTTVGATYNITVNGTSIMTSEITYVSMEQCLVDIVNDINGTTPSGQEKSVATITGPDQITLTYSKDIGDEYNTFTIANTGTGVIANVVAVAGGKNSLLKVIKAQVGDKNFGYRFNFTTDVNTISPSLSKFDFIIEQSGIEEMVDNRDVSVRFDDNFLYIKNKTNEDKVLNIKLGY